MNQPGIKCWLSLSNRTITTVGPNSSTANRFTEGRFLTKEDLVQLSIMVAAEIYAKQQEETLMTIPKKEHRKTLDIKIITEA